MTTHFAPPETIRNDKNVGVKKDILTQICRRAENTGRFAKRFSGERPDPLGFEFVFLPSLSELFGGCLTAPRSGALV